MLLFATPRAVPALASPDVRSWWLFSYQRHINNTGNICKITSRQNPNEYRRNNVVSRPKTAVSKAIETCANLNLFVGLKSKVAAWAIGKGVDDYLKKSNVDKKQRQRIVEAVKAMLSPKKEPVMFGGAISVAVALGAAFGLELTTEELSITIATVISIVTFIQRKLVSPKK